MDILEQIQQKEDALLKAMLESNVDMLDTLISNDLLFTDHTGHIVTKADDLQAHRSHSLSLENITPSEQRIKTYNDTVIVSVLMHIKGSFLNHPFEGKIRYTRVWLNLDNNWKIVAGHSTMVNG